MVQGYSLVIRKVKRYPYILDTDKLFYAFNSVKINIMRKKITKNEYMIMKQEDIID